MSKFFETPLLYEAGVLNSSNDARARRFLSDIYSWSEPVGLCHGDLKPDNTIMHNRKVTLLGWGTAEANFAPAFDIGTLHCWSHYAIGTPGCNNAFHEGYGLTAHEVK